MSFLSLPFKIGTPLVELPVGRKLREREERSTWRWREHDRFSIYLKVTMFQELCTDCHAQHKIDPKNPERR
ncbi:hypothetical protein AKJ62_01930 [candidate division MSBL1 archaeon SCGC-AAA259D14]|uniref:Uncharacterized protein n=1 Tax=candidate division MSBL1 archaeon SCGC-AAA259D14 TaxID=1698261 RepID=A0A133U720_9EURY|nr:hypothetical protein AKJ62_01930 [candidate division MSBL1 archaeon SCGC-AAA259D14]